MSLIDNLRKRALVWASQISRKANSAPGKPQMIRVRSRVEVRGGKVGIISTASAPKPIARAYEYGSGIHSRVKKRSKWQQADKTILIRPRTKKVLAFQWDVLAGDPAGTWYGGKKLIKKAADGRALFRFVNHPGVRAAGGGKGYLSPAIAEVRKQIRRELSKEFRDTYIGSFRKAFK